MRQRLKFESFRSSFKSWETLFGKACDFADSVGRDNVLNISHSCDANGEGVVTVWYWAEERAESFTLNKVNFTN